MVFNMLKPFLTPEVRDGVVFHSGNLATLRSVSVQQVDCNMSHVFCVTITKTVWRLCQLKGWNNLIDHASSCKLDFFLRVYISANGDVLMGITFAIPETTKFFAKSLSLQWSLPHKPLLQGLCASRHSPFWCGRRQKCTTHGKSAARFLFVECWRVSLTECELEQDSSGGQMNSGWGGWCHLRGGAKSRG